MLEILLPKIELQVSYDYFVNYLLTSIVDIVMLIFTKKEKLVVLKNIVIM